MALKKTLELESGVVGDYWKIKTISIDFSTEIARAALHLYINQEARLAGKAYVHTIAINVSSPDFKGSSLSDKSPLITAYELIKQLPEFELAEDV